MTPREVLGLVFDAAFDIASPFKCFVFNFEIGICRKQGGIL